MTSLSINYVESDEIGYFLEKLEDRHKLEIKIICDKCSERHSSGQRSNTSLKNLLVFMVIWAHFTRR